MIRVLIADDHPIVREGLKQVLAKARDIIIAGEASSGIDALSGVLSGTYDVVLLDISLPDKSGIEVLKEMKIRKPDIPVLILSMHPEEEYAVRALKAGASGYLTKDSAPYKLVDAIRKVASGKKYISESTAVELLENLKSDGTELPHHSLSDREYEIMLMIASGKRIKDIGRELTLSDKTISTYRNRILTKMKLSSNADITRYVIEKKLTG